MSSAWLILPSAPVLYGLAGVLGVLVASLVLSPLAFRDQPAARIELLRRVRSWWVICALLALIFLTPSGVGTVVIGFIAFLALKEYFALIPLRPSDRILMFWCYVALVVQFYWSSTMDHYGMFAIFIPVYLYLFLCAVTVMGQNTRHFLAAVSVFFWGMIATVYALSHASLLLSLPLNSAVALGKEMLLFLLVFTALNDVFQFISGKLIGKRKVLPNVSPGKTWGGLIGGILLSTAFAVLAGPFLTPASWQMMLWIGPVLSVAGFFGDVTMSALKRDVGVKDSGNILPGHGGVLDRVDSLIYTAPIFFHVMRFFYGAV